MDILTQAYHRATVLWYMEKDLLRYNQLESERRQNQTSLILPPLSLIFLDIDHFGAFNKAYDHLMGDEVLKGVVARIKARIRTTDILGRYGGEEFMIYLPNTSLPQAIELAEQVRQKIESPAFEVPTHGAVTVTASLGVAQYHAGMSTDDFIRAANMKMKIAKDTGRNKVAG